MEPQAEEESPLERHRKASARPIMRESGQAPAPSKDFHEVLVTEQSIVWRTWPISIRSGGHPHPTERVIPKEDYQYDYNTRSDVKRILGETIEARVLRFSKGGTDFFSRLPRAALMRILELLDLHSLRMLSFCNHFLNESCNDDELWKQIYLNHHGYASEELDELAKEIGWWTIFFTGRLQLQVLLSRKRRTGSARNRPTTQCKDVFLTS